MCPLLSIAMAGALTGPDSALGIDIRDGVLMAVDEHNAANPGCQVQLQPFDTAGDEKQAGVVAGRLLEDAYTVGLVGPAFSGDVTATGEIFDRAGLVATTPSATNPTLSTNGWRTFFRGVASDDVQGPAVANYMKKTLGLRRVCVVDDDTEYGLGLAMRVRETLGPVAASACNIAIKRGDTDFSGPVAQIKAAEPDSVFFSGYYAEAAPFVNELRSSGVTAMFVGGDGVKTPAFVEQAGASSKDAVISCPCSPVPPAFVEKYTAKFGRHPGGYSAEAYDLGTILLSGIDSGAITRPNLLDYVRSYQGNGIAGSYAWTPTGELRDPRIFIYRVE